MYYEENGEMKPIYAKTSDTLPIGTVVRYDGDTVPDGYEEVEDINTYSTDEKRIGTWIDSRPVYRKVIEFGTLPDNNNKRVTFNIPNIDIVIKLYTVGNRENGTYPVISYNGSDYSTMYMDKTNNFIEIRTSAARSTYSAYIIIEYTKTTD